MPDSFLTVTDLGDYLGRDLSADAAAQIAIEGACDMVRTITEQEFQSVASATVDLDGTGTDTLLLPNVPVTSVTSVTESGTVLTADEDYELGDLGILYRLPGLIDSGWGTEQLRTYWWPGRQNIVVVYSYGYLAADIPHDIRMVALTLAGRFLNQAVQGTTTEESLGAYSVRYSTTQTTASSDLTKGELAILRKYKVAK